MFLFRDGIDMTKELNQSKTLIEKSLKEEKKIGWIHTKILLIIYWILSVNQQMNIFIFYINNIKYNVIFFISYFFLILWMQLQNQYVISYLNKVFDDREDKLI